MAYTPQFLDEIRDRASLASVIGRHVRLTKRGRDYIGLCPFHKEKTPSFNVVEDKNFYHCFGCGAHGDVIGFTMRVSNLSFQEAVQTLAREAGLAIPVESPHERAREAHAASLHDVCEAACAYFERQLQANARARDYLGGRGVGAELRQRFRLGYAPGGGAELAAALTSFPAELVEEAGLVRKDPGGMRRYDFFRDRVIFPIFDRRDRVIAFGGRALGDAQPKYLNSPDTPIFQKGMNLYALNIARKRAAEAALVVVEGYMDVIALHGAGFVGAVAPLGTALTEHQIAEIWRLAPEPVLSFDGDSAGRRAAERAIDRFLPLLNATRRLNFVALPDGDDPDSLIQKLGRPGFQRFLEGAKPLSRFLWDLATDGRSFATPERLMELDRGLKQRFLRIEDRDTQRGYLQFLNDQLWDLRQQERRRGAPRKSAAPSPEFQRIAQSWAADATGEKIKLVLLAAAINHPQIVRQDIDRFSALMPKRRDLVELHQSLMQALADHSDVERNELVDLLQTAGFGPILNRIFSSAVYRAHGFAGPLAPEEVALARWNATAARLDLPTMRQQLEEAVARMGAEPNVEDWERILLFRQIYEDQNMEAELMHEGRDEVERIAEWRPGGADAPLPPPSDPAEDAPLDKP